MQSCYPEAISRVLKSEGGYSNHPSDPGGETMYGITVAVARANGYTGAMRTMPLDEAKRIYKARYADPCHFDDLPAGLDYAILDYAVNSGVGRANKVLRRVLALDDAAPFHQILGQLSTRDPKAVINAVCDERLRFLSGLKTWSVFDEPTARSPDA
jgi:lysozyme family protein